MTRHRLVAGLLLTAVVVGSAAGAVASGWRPPADSSRATIGAFKHVRIPSHDGVLLNSFVALPKGAQKNLPTVLINTLYLGGCSIAQQACLTQPSWGDDTPAE